MSINEVEPIVLDIGVDSVRFDPAVTAIIYFEPDVRVSLIITFFAALTFECNSLAHKGLNSLYIR